MNKREYHDAIYAERSKRSQSIAKTISGLHRIASTGTPHTIVTIHGVTYSICWFPPRVIRGIKKRSCYRIFWPFPSKGAPQDRRTYYSRTGLVAHINKIKEVGA